MSPRAGTAGKGVLLTALLLFLGAQFLFIVVDATGKYLVRDFPVLGVVWARYYFHFLFNTPRATYVSGIEIKFRISDTGPGIVSFKLQDTSTRNLAGYQDEIGFGANWGRDPPGYPDNAGGYVWDAWSGYDPGVWTNLVLEGSLYAPGIDYTLRLAYYDGVWRCFLNGAIIGTRTSGRGGYTTQFSTPSYGAILLDIYAGCVDHVWIIRDVP